MVPLSPLRPTCTSQDVPASLVAASTSQSNHAAATYLCSQVDSHQLMSQQDSDCTDTLVQAAAASFVDSAVEDLVEDVLMIHNTATAYAVDAVVEQLVSEAICDAETANYAMKQSSAVDSVLDDLVSYVVDDDKAAQVEVVNTVLDELISNAVHDVQAALADLNISTTAVDAVLEEVISSVVAEAGAESAAPCQPCTAQSLVSEPTGNVSEAVGSLSKGPGMPSACGAHQTVRTASYYSPPQAADSSGGAVRQQVQQLRRDMEQLSKGIHLEVYKVPSLTMLPSIQALVHNHVSVRCTPTPSVQLLLHTYKYGFASVPGRRRFAAECDCLW